MKYFKNTELAKLYHISEKSVRNWVQAAQDGKLDLKLYEENDRSHVANTAKNTALIEDLVRKGKKYKNSRGAKNISPKDDFYAIYSQKQILDIIANLTIHHEIPLQYSYVDGGAGYWNQYANRLSSEQRPNILTRTIELLDMVADNMDQLLDTHKKINVLDIGPGNGLPVREMLARLLGQGRLGRYIAIDISQDMLNILEKNIKLWFGNKVQFEGHIRDISYERFDDLFVEEHVDADNDMPANVVLFLGGTLSNFRSPNQVLQAINNSLGVNDLLIYTGYLDTPHTRRYFDFNLSDENHKLAAQDKLILDFLNIDESLYDAEHLFSEEKQARSISIRPKIDLSIGFKLANGTRHVELRKNESILLWRHRHRSAIDIIKLFDEFDFDLLQAAKSKDQEYCLVISRIKTSTDLV